MTQRRRRWRRATTAAAGAIVVAALALGACSRSTASDDRSTTGRATTGTTAPAVASVPSTGPAAPTTTPTGAAADTGTPDEAKFCDATTVLITVPDDQTPQQYEAAVAASTATMVASVPDRTLVPLMRQMQQAYALYAKIATAESADDPTGAAQAVADAEAVFPPADQERFAAYVKRQCGVDIGS